MLSTITYADSCVTVTHKQKDGTHTTTLHCPTAIITYNENMVGVDRSDQLRSYYKWRLKCMSTSIHSAVLGLQTTVIAGESGMEYSNSHYYLTSISLSHTFHLSSSLSSSGFIDLQHPVWQEIVHAGIVPSKRMCYRFRTQQLTFRHNNSPSLDS